MKDMPRDGTPALKLRVALLISAGVMIGLLLVKIFSGSNPTISSKSVEHQIESASYTDSSSQSNELSARTPDPDIKIKVSELVAMQVAKSTRPLAAGEYRLEISRKLITLLGITPTEKKELETSLADAFEKTSLAEATNVKAGVDSTGRTTWEVAPFPELQAEIMTQLSEEIYATVGDGRGGFIVRTLRNTPFFRKRGTGVTMNFEESTDGSLLRLRYGNRGTTLRKSHVLRSETIGGFRRFKSQFGHIVGESGLETIRNTFSDMK